jgi:hypothetical protein
LSLVVVVVVFRCRRASICALRFAAAVAEFDLSLLLPQKKKKQKIV